ncbi:MAG: acyl-CoA thioesterase [Isosphaeraceae bacterium]
MRNEPNADAATEPPIPTDAKPASASRLSLAIITHPGQANPFGTLHGGVLLHLADECGGISALRHAGGGRVTTAALDAMIFLRPVRVGERVEVVAEVSYVGRTSMEVRIEIWAEPLDRAEGKKVGMGYGVYVALDAEGKPRPVPALLRETEADRRRDEAGKARQAARLARWDESSRGNDRD